MIELNGEEISDAMLALSVALSQSPDAGGLTIGQLRRILEIVQPYVDGRASL